MSNSGWEYNWKVFEPELIEKCTAVIQGIAKSEHPDFHSILWHPKTMAMIVQIDGTRELLKILNSAWRASKRSEAGIKICAVIMAVEVLDLDMFGWGTFCPDARRAAQSLLGSADEVTRTRMLSIFRVVDPSMGEKWMNTMAEAFAITVSTQSGQLHD
jgi:hypothetical protein